MSSSLSFLSETAIIVAGCRASEGIKKKALFNDNLSHLLLKKEGQRIFKKFKNSKRFNLFNTSVVVRTYVLDKMIRKVIKKRKIKQVINLGAGLDTRPYRLRLDESIIWWELDQQDIIAHKEKVLSAHTANCNIKRKAVDLNNIKRLSEFISNNIDMQKETLVLSEGFLIYIHPNIVNKLLSLFSILNCCTHWITDIGSEKILDNNINDPSSNFTHLLNYMKFFSSPYDMIYSRNNWKVKKFKDLAVEAIKLDRPLTNNIIDKNMNNELIQIRSLQWAKQHYFLCLENSMSDML